MEPVVGFEPTTDGLQNRCSTTELNWPEELFAGANSTGFYYGMNGGSASAFGACARAWSETKPDGRCYVTPPLPGFR
jgi:hypothetical protein